MILHCHQRPGAAYDNFELISADVKANPLNPDPEKGRPLPPTANELAQQIGWSTNCAKLLKIPEEPPAESAVKFPDLMDEASLLEWAGISIGKGDVYRLYLSVKKFAESLPGEVDRLRFFGRISTRGLPYYILEGLSAEEEEGIDESKQETRSGANKYSYWVTQSIESGTWTKLPNVTMAQVVAARQFKRFLTGNLYAGVPSYPPFPGYELNLLRAQIARITGESIISPDGFFEIDGDSDPPVAKAAEAEAIAGTFPKSAADLANPEAWKHHETELNVLGRITKLPEQLGPDGEPIPDETELIAPLSGLKENAWTFRICPGGAGTNSAAGGSIVVARSLIWPGSVSVAAGRRFLNIYVGNGVIYDSSVKSVGNAWYRTTNIYSPPLPGTISTEWAPAEEEAPLIEQPDKLVDPTPPAPIEEGGEE